VDARELKGTVMRLIDLVYTPNLEKWTDQAKEAFQGLYGSPEGRYPSRAAKRCDFAAAIHGDSFRRSHSSIKRGSWAVRWNELCDFSGR
jgi:hypothetical protein